MDKNTGSILNSINTGVENINQENRVLQEASSDTINNSITEAASQITQAISGLGDGLKLNNKKSTEKPESPKPNKKDNDELEKQLAKEMSNMPDSMLALLTQLTLANSTLTSMDLALTSNSQNEDEEDEIKIAVDDNSRDPKKIGTMTNIPDLCAQGFTVTANFLKDIAEMMSKILTNATAGASGNAASLEAANKTKPSQEKPAKTSSKGALSEFFIGLAGPLQSIATGLLLLSASIAILSLVNIDTSLVLKMILLQGFFLVTFGVLSFISSMYLEKQMLLDPKGKQKGSLVGVVKEFATSIAIMAATFLFIGIVVDIIKDQWLQTLTGIVLIFAATFVMIYAISLLSGPLKKAMKAPDGPIALIKTILILVFSIIAVSLICWFFWDFIQDGLLKAMLIFGLAMAMVAVVMKMAQSMKGIGKQIDAVYKIIISVIVLVVVLAVLTIILGLIPTGIIVQGLITISLITALAVGLIYFLAQTIKQVQKVSADKLKAVTTILIVAIAMIAIISILVLVLGSQQPGVIAQGLITMALICAVPIILAKALVKVSDALSKQLPQVILGLALTAFITVSVSIVAWLIIEMLGNFKSSQILNTMLAISLTVALLVFVGFATLAIASVSAMLAGPQIALALIGIAMASVISVALAGLALLLGTILPMEKAKAAVVATAAITLLTVSLVIIAGSVIALAALAIPLTIATALAVVSVGAICVFLTALSSGVILLGAAIGLLLETVNLERFQTGVTMIGNILLSFVKLTAIMTSFAVVGAILAVAVTVSAALLLGTTVGMSVMTASMIALSKVVNKIPARINTKPLVNTIKDLNSFSNALGTFKAPPVAKMAAVTLTASFAKKLAKSISGIATSSNTSAIKALSDSLNSLAISADPMERLADAITHVADATKQLNAVTGSTGTVNVDDLTGKFGSLAAFTTLKLSTPAPEKTTDTTSQALKEILDAIKDLKFSMDRMADAAAASARTEATNASAALQTSA